MSSTRRPAYRRRCRRFGGKRVDLVVDSGPIFWLNPILAGAFPVWNTNAVIPNGCVNCWMGYTHLYSYLAKTYPQSRFAFLIHDQDAVISLGNLAASFPSALRRR